MISKDIIFLLKNSFSLDWDGIHGVSHWSRVRLNGLEIAKNNGANNKIIELFSFFHDSMRENDNHDPLHGERAAKFIEDLSLQFLDINQQEKDLLMTACRYHTSRLSDTSNKTILTCWDSDALDLGRVGIYPLSERLNTDFAKQEYFIKACYARSIGSSNP